MKNIIGLIIIIAIGYFSITKVFHKENWTLMACESLMPNGVECQDNSYKIPGFASSKECMLEGVSKFSKQGFECGSNCHPSESGIIDVCDEICNKNGCSK